MIILKHSPTPPSPLGLLEQFPVIKNIFTENSFFKNETQFQENEIPAPLLHDKYPFQWMRVLPRLHLQYCHEKRISIIRVKLCGRPGIWLIITDLFLLLFQFLSRDILRYLLTLLKPKMLEKLVRDPGNRECILGSIAFVTFK